MSKLETNTIDTISGSTTLTLGGTNATTIAQDSATTVTGFKSTGIDDNASSTAVTIDSSQNVGIGTTSPTAQLHIENSSTEAGALLKTTASDTGVTLVLNGNKTSNTGGIGSIQFQNSGDSVGMIRSFRESANDAGGLSFWTQATGGANSERMRINSAGKVGIGDATLASNAILSVEGNIGSPLVTFYDKRSTSTLDVFAINSDFGGTETRHFLLEADGDIFNTNNSYGSLSDRKFKENETDANSQWNDIKALKIKNYNLKKFPDIKHLGVIAQDLEASGMNGLVKNKPDVLYTENDVLPEGKNIGDIKEENYKEVKYSVLYMKAVKALQEAMERIETLEAKVTALENA